MIWLEALSYLVTILGFPTAIFVFVYEHRRRLANEESELHRHLSEEYDNFLKLVLENSDLLPLRVPSPPSSISQEQIERREILYGMLISLFEKAYIILYSLGDALLDWLNFRREIQEQHQDLMRSLRDFR